MHFRQCQVFLAHVFLSGKLTDPDTRPPAPLSGKSTIFLFETFPSWKIPLFFLNRTTVFFVLLLGLWLLLGCDNYNDWDWAQTSMIWLAYNM